MMSKLNKPKRGTTDSLPLDSTTKGPTDLAEPAPVLMSAVVSKLEKLCSALIADLTAEFQNSFVSFKASNNAIQTTVTSHGHRIDILEHLADDTGDRVQIERAIQDQSRLLQNHPDTNPLHGPGRMVTLVLQQVGVA
ncbi:UNVERIFIED_CONTAM: hypothetical protein FKN15_054969 [Acipenser sinensis]